jgi:hypothetical protein
MDEEELEQPKKKKITLSNFFESIVSIDKLANRALSIANSNLNIIQDQKLLIESLSMSLEGLRSDVQQINNYIIVEKKIEKDEEADLRLEEEDKEQKEMMAERLKGDKGEDGDQGEGGDQGDQGDQGDAGKAPPQPVEPKGFLGSIFGALGPLLGGAGLQLLAPILGGAFTGLKTGGPIGALIGGPLGGALEYSGMRESLTGETPSPKTNFFETINPFARLGGMFGRKFGKKGEKDEKDQVKEEIKSEIKEELNFTSKKLTTRFDREKGVGYVNGQEVDAQKYAEFKRLSAKEQLDQGLDFFKEDTDEFSLKGTKDIKPEKKENKLLEFVKEGGVAGFLGRKIFGGKEDKKKDVDVDDSNKLTTEREQGQVVGGNVSQEQSDLMARDRELEMLIDSEYETGGKINYDKIAEYEKEQEEIQNKLFNLDDKDSVQPEKKENKLIEFMKEGGVAGFLNRRIGDSIRNFDGRPGSRKTKGKNEFYDKDGNYIGDNERKLEFERKKNELLGDKNKIPMETTINPDGSITSKGSGILINGELYKPGEQMTLKQRLSIQARIQMQGEDTVKPEMLKDFYNSGGPLSKEESAEYMKSQNLEAGAFTDDDLVQPDEKRGVKEIIGGVADTLTGGVFDFDKKGNNKLQDFQQGVMKTVTDNTFGKMKRLYNEDRKTPELKLSGEAERLIGDDKPFLDEVQRVSEKYEINPADLVGLMASESSLDPAADNGTHVGLIQFSADRAEELGTTQEELVKMSRAQQMKFVEKYFDIVKLPKGASKGELYTSVFMPEYTDRGTDFELSTKFDKFSDGEPGNPSVYAANQGLDADEDGFITIEEMGSRITSKQNEFGISSEKESKPEGIMRILTGLADRVTGEKFDFDQRGDLIPKLENDTAELSGNVLAPPDDSYPKLSAGVIQTLNESALTANPSPLVQAEAPQVSEAEIKSTETTSSFIKTISNNTIASSRKSKFGLPSEIMRMIT